MVDGGTLGASEASARGGLRPRDARPRRGRLHRRRGGPGRRRAPGAAPARPGMRMAFITNNASRPPESVAEHLRELGVEADTSDVVTSAQAAARLLGERFGEGARVALLGGRRAGRRAAGRAAGAGGRGGGGAWRSSPATAPDVLWRDVMRAAVLVRDGLPWVASNTDLTIPTAYGTAPGHGVLVGLLGGLRRRAARGGGQARATAARRDDPPRGWPAAADGGRPPGHRHRRRRQRRRGQPAGDDRGDRPRATWWRCRTGERPTYVGPDLGALLEAHRGPRARRRRDPPGRVVRPCARTVGWSSRARAAPGDWWRVVAAAAWAELDRAGSAVDTTELEAAERRLSTRGPVRCRA